MGSRSRTAGRWKQREREPHDLRSPSVPGVFCTLYCECCDLEWPEMSREEFLDLAEHGATCPAGHHHTLADLADHSLRVEVVESHPLGLETLVEDLALEKYLERERKMLTTS